MKKLLVFLFIIMFSFSVFAQDSSSLYGNWTLTSWSIGIEMDLNKDGKSQLNLLAESSCKNNEILSISKTNTLTSSKTFNPTINVSKSGNDYHVSEKCNKGSIGFSNAFEISSARLNLDIGGYYKLVNGNLVRTFTGAINVFNADFSEVIETKDLTITYSKN